LTIDRAPRDGRPFFLRINGLEKLKSETMKIKKWKSL